MNQKPTIFNDMLGHTVLNRVSTCYPPFPTFQCCFINEQRSFRLLHYPALERGKRVDVLTTFVTEDLQYNER